MGKTTVGNIWAQWNGYHHVFAPYDSGDFSLAYDDSPSS